MRLPLLIALCSSILVTDPLSALEPAVNPIIQWDFGNLPEVQFKGKVSADGSGPRPPLFPEFDESNRALALHAPSYARLPDELNEDFQFDNGDTITAEAWVNLQTFSEHAYIIGKGRTETGKNNQNWAFRLRKGKGLACVNFLFRSRGDESGAGDWHRWTSSDGFAVGSGWHHVAIRYQFGDPKSIRGFLDGKAVKGKWDMGGATKKPPVVDDAEVWVGSSMGGLASNSLNGRIDNLVVYRGSVPDGDLLSRYRFVPQPIKRPEIPPGKVLAQLFGPVAQYASIPHYTDAPVRQWHQDTLALTRLPLKYDSWGVRDDWTDASRHTMMLRAWTDITLEPGDYQLLVRSRGYSRLSVDEKEIVTTPKMVSRTGAHHVVDPLPKVAVPGMRPHFMNDHERIVEFHSDGGTHQFLLELMIGGPKYRLEVGETCVAIARGDEMFHLISPQTSIPLSDAGWRRIATAQQQMFTRMDRIERRQRASQQNDFWDKRHQYAKQELVAKAQDASIDQIIGRRIEAANELAATVKSKNANRGGVFYREHIDPILQTHCVRCHGDKEQGELSVLDRERLLAGGESGEPAIVPNQPDKSHLLELVSADADDYRMPPKGDGLSETEIAAIRQWISTGAEMPQIARTTIQPTSLVDDPTFLRRVFIDTVGVPPTIDEAKAFLSDTSANRREVLVDRLLSDDRWADNWVGYWQDVLAENPNLLKPTLNNTGPFRYWIYESLLDNKPIDRFATELILMRGSKWYGGAGGFSIASQNDVPMAAKAHVIGTAFMGVELKCARCHDAPYHSWKQSDLFQMAAMLDRKVIKLPETSTVPAAFFDQQQRKPLIDVTLKPGSDVRAEWPFAELSPQVAADLLQSPSDSREALAAQVTSSRRFAEVVANRMWARLMGAGIVQPVDDWEGNPPSDQALLAKLADTLIESGYDLKQLAREILTSDVYARKALTQTDSERFFAGPYRRRMTAEQIVDSALHVVGIAMNTEQLTLDVEGTLPADKFLNFGFPRRSWEFTTLANERDRPSLALPKAQAITDVLKAFGWRNSRPEPTSHREEAANLIQPGVLANGTLGVWLTRLSDDSDVTKAALEAATVEQFVDQLFIRLLTRQPTTEERTKFIALLEAGFDKRIVKHVDMKSVTKQRQRHRYVSWSNHLNTEANVIKIQMQAEVRRGPEPTRYLESDWRSRAEDAVWALINSPEMILIP